MLRLSNLSSPDVRSLDSLVNIHILMFGSCRTLLCYSERVWAQGPVNSGTLLKSWNSWVTFMWFFCLFVFLFCLSNKRTKKEGSDLFVWSHKPGMLTMLSCFLAPFQRRRCPVWRFCVWTLMSTRGHYLPTSIISNTIFTVCFFVCLFLPLCC